MAEWNNIRHHRLAKYTMSITVSLTGVEAHTIRRYEIAGLVRPRRTGAGQRLYSDSEIGMIREISRLCGKGINLEGIKAIMALRRGQQI